MHTGRTVKRGWRGREGGGGCEDKEKEWKKKKEEEKGGGGGVKKEKEAQDRNPSDGELRIKGSLVGDGEIQCHTELQRTSQCYILPFHYRNGKKKEEEEEREKRQGRRRRRARTEVERRRPS